MDGLGGSEWNRRPAGGNSMWRLYYLSRKDNVPLTLLGWLEVDLEKNTAKQKG